MSFLESDNESLLKLSNPELDRKIGGLPLPSLTLIEGANDSGKTIIAQQITYGALVSNRKVLYITEDTAKGLITNMERLNWSIVDKYLVGRFKITSLNILNMFWNPDVSKYYLIALTNYVRQKTSDFDIIILDSLTHLITHASEKDILDFFSSCRYIVDQVGRTFVINVHPYALSQELMIRVRSLCDGHIILENKTFRDRIVLTMNVAKLKGASKNISEVIGFEVSPAYGIKVLQF